MKSQSGQSMVEFAVGSATLSLLLLGTLALAGYQEVDRRVVISARNSGWLESWSLMGTDARARVRAIHDESFSDSGVLEPMGRRLLVEETGLELTTGRGQPSGIAGGAGDLLLAPLRVSSGFLGRAFDLSERGLFLGHVRATIGAMAGMPEPFSHFELRLESPYALLGDAWHAGSAGHVRDRAAGLVPSSRLAAFSTIWRPLALPLGILEPSLRQLCFGLIEPDRIPEDRLGPGRTSLPGDCP
jgi:hypothetical protein